MEKKKVRMKSVFTALIQRDGPWWVGWIEEIPGVNGQGRTRREFMANLKSALKEALEMNREEALSATQGAFEEVSIEV